jgi:hypothetical protein
LREDTTFSEAIPVEKRVAIFWHLATKEDLRSLAWRFGVGKSTTGGIINEVCQAVFEILHKQHIHLSTLHQHKIIMITRLH